MLYITCKFDLIQYSEGNAKNLTGRQGRELITENRPQIRRVLKKHGATKKMKEKIKPKLIEQPEFRDQRLPVIHRLKRWYFDVYVTNLCQ